MGRNHGWLAELNLKGMRIHIAGSADRFSDPGKLLYSHQLVRLLVQHVLASGGGIVASLVSEPHHSKNRHLARVFDWTVLEQASKILKSLPKDWPIMKGPRIAVVGLPNWGKKIPSSRRKLWSELVDSGRVGLVQVRSSLRFGGMLRQIQQEYGDVLVIIGGGPGAEHLAELYESNHKPVIPIDISLGASNKPRAGEKLAELAMEDPDRFFATSSSEKSAARFSSLSFRDGLPNVVIYEQRFFDFITQLKGPKAFYVRLQDSGSKTFRTVESFFRCVVDPVIEDMGYDRFEVGRNISREGMINAEIFQGISSSSLVIVDLTALRPNCFVEGGFAFGLGKSVILMAKKGTKLPFDLSAVHCHFWESNLSDKKRQSKLRRFIRKNGQRRLVHPAPLIT